MVPDREVHGFDLARRHQSEVGDLTNDGEIAARQLATEVIEPDPPQRSGTHNNAPSLSSVRALKVEVRGGGQVLHPDTNGRQPLVEEDR